MENADTYPLVTVVIPTYNRASLLPEAIRSVLSQSYPHFEIIITDDGSTDNTHAVVASFSDPRIRLLQIPHSGHPGVARNAGARSGSGKWIAFLDSDDLWLPGKLELQAATLMSTGRKWCYGNFQLVNETAGSLKESARPFLPLEGMITAGILMNEVAVFIGTLVVDRQVFEQLGGFREDPGIAFREDLDFVLRLSLQEEASALQEVLTQLRVHPGRSTRGIAASFEISSRVYDLFRKEKISNKLRRIALARQAYLLSEAAASQNRELSFGQRMKLMKRSLVYDKTFHWLSCLARAIKISR